MRFDQSHRLDAHSGRLRVPRSSVDSADYWLVEGNARDIVSADRSPPSVPRGREVCASWNAFPWREMMKKKGKGRETSRREARVKFDARGT